MSELLQSRWCNTLAHELTGAEGDRDGLDADNGQLFYEVVRLIKHHSPSAFLLENVANLMSIDNGDAFRVILQVNNSSLHPLNIMHRSSKLVGTM